ncbi:hypothetical protein WMZ97_05480 [Lentibacillus sp. N15]|uniref:hypothetical protein n=1 Tax=Lentibacillus songyuanensis TaxID=3136161 RepID=UPI0031BB2192
MKKESSIIKMEQLSFGSLLDDNSQPEKAHISQNRTIHENRKTFPINLIIDFDQFMDYMEQYSFQLTKIKEYIPPKHLPKINEQLSIPADGVTNHIQQEYYPYIHLFYHLAISGHLLEKVTISSSKVQLRFTDRWTMYKALTDTEKYLFWFETFWADVNWAQLLDQHKNPVHHMLSDVFTKLITKKSGDCLNLEQERLLANLIFQWNYFFLYMKWFGIWICKKDQDRIDHYGKKKMYFAKTITLTSFGKNMIPILLETRDLQTCNIPLRCEHGEVNPLPGSTLPEMRDDHSLKKRWENRNDPQPFYQAFTDLFPKRDLQSTLPRLERKFTSGMHTFKVTLTNNM